MDGITQFPANAGSQECQYERVDKTPAHTGYMCGLPARWTWEPEEGVQAVLCNACKRWLETLESLGLNKS